MLDFIDHENVAFINKTRSLSSSIETSTFNYFDNYL